MIDALVYEGVTRVRLTGGEPLLHPQVSAIVREITRRPEIVDLALTTNATRLESLAKPLARAGLQRLTISIDSLDPERFWRITRGGQLAEVLAGVDAAVAQGFQELKLNTVVVRGENDDELPHIVEYAWARGMTPRFIEVMRIGEGSRLPEGALVGYHEMLEQLRDLIVVEPPVADRDRGPARYLRARDGSGRRVGFITGTTDTYCAGCDRLRIASNGVIRPCLATNDGLAARDEAEALDGESVARKIQEAWLLKPDGEQFRGCTESSAASVSIRSIGG